MIIWEEDRQRHLIRIGGKKKAYVTADDFPFETPMEENEIAIKQYIDSTLRKEPYHSYCHIFTKPTASTPTDPINYALWLGHEDQEPPEEWWLGE